MTCLFSHSGLSLCSLLPDSQGTLPCMPVGYQWPPIILRVETLKCPSSDPKTPDGLAASHPSGLFCAFILLPLISSHLTPVSGTCMHWACFHLWAFAQAVPPFWNSFYFRSASSEKPSLIHLPASVA